MALSTFFISLLLICSISFGLLLAWNVYKLDKQNFLFKVTAISILWTVAVSFVEHELFRQTNYEIAYQLSSIHTIINSMAIFWIVFAVWVFTQPFPQKKYPYLSKILFSGNLLIISIVWIAELMGNHAVHKIHQGIIWQYEFQLNWILGDILVSWYGLQAIATLFALWSFYQRREKRAIKKWVSRMTVLCSLLIGSIFIFFVFNDTQVSTGYYLSSPALLSINTFFAYLYTNFKLFKIQPINALDNILESMYHSMIITDTDFNFTYLNNAARKELGTAEKGIPDFNLKNFAQIYKLDNWEEGLIAVQNLAKGKKLVKEIQVQHEGSIFFFQMNFSPVFSYNNRKTGYLVMATNITKLKQATTQLQQYNQALKQKNTELERFVYIASHDLKTPLLNVICFLDLMQKHTDKHYQDADLQEYLAFATTGAKQMNHIIEDVLEFSQLNTEKFSPSVSVNLNEVVQKVCQSLRVVIKEKNADFQIHDLPTILGIPSQMKQLFQNLIENGIKYNNNERPTITIKSIIQKEHFQIIVTDNGIGINERYKESIFEMFKRLHTAREYEGTGIGLAICKKIMTQYRGEIQLESEEGKGSQFVLSFPKRFLKMDSQPHPSYIESS
ncbi:MAG: ATP-binding protein [Saprospiraceae bacterium]